MKSPDLNKTAHFLESILSVAHEGVVMVDREGVIRWANPVLKEVLGTDDSKLLGNPFYTLVYKDRAQQEFSSQNPRIQFQNAEKAPVEYRFVDGRGRSVPVRFRSFILRDEAGEFQQGVGLVLPLEQKSEAARTPGNSLGTKMWEAQQNFENVMKNSSDAIVICDTNGNVSVANQAFARLVDLPPEELTGCHITEFTVYREGVYTCTTGEQVKIDREYVEATAEKPAEMYAEGSVSNWLAYFTRKNNTVVPVDISMSLLKDKSEENRGSVVIARNMTERKRAENELKRTKEYLENLFSTSLDGIIVTDNTGTISMTNRAIENMLDYGPGELIGHATTELALKEQGYDRLGRELVEKLFGAGSVTGFEHVWQRKSGGLVDVEINVALLKDEEENVIGSISSVRDITERKRAAEALQQAKEAAEAASQYKSTFLANMSHEIRTPMNSVIGFTDMLLDTNLDDEQEDCVKTVRQSADALLALINDILDLSRIEAENIRFEEIDFDLEILACDVCEIIYPRRRSSEVEIICRIGDSLPALVRGDPHRFRQVLLNLMGNAAKFTSQGEIELSVDVEDEQPGQITVRCQVRDTGVGIPADKIQSIFEVFQQADSSVTRKYGGTGLGLSISRKIAGLMGGNVWAESEPGRGSTFHFTAVLKTADRKDVKRVESVGLAGRKALVTDDNPSNLSILVKMLESAGMQVQGYLSSREAADALCQGLKEKDAFDLCIFDIHMPDMSGYELAKQVRSDAGGSLPLMAISSSMEKGLAVACREAGFNGFLPKPINRTKLFKMVRRLLSESSASKKAASGAPASGFLTQHSMIEDSKHGASILLAEDNPVNQKLAVKLLEKAGYTVTVAEDGKAAVERFAAEPSRYDLILMDIQMPELSGLDAARRLRAQGFRNVPIIAMTANAMKGDREKCLEAGMDDYISKPIKREIVFEMLKKWVIDKS